MVRLEFINSVRIRLNIYGVEIPNKIKKKGQVTRLDGVQHERYKRIYNIQSDFNKQGKEKYRITSKKHYSYNPDDMLYYNDDNDEDYYMEVPKNGKKTLVLSINGRARLLVKLDRK